MTCNFTYYDLLGVQSNATNAELAIARTLARKLYLSDVNPSPNADGTAALIATAFATLENSDTRAAYDAAIRSDANQPPLFDDDPDDWDVQSCAKCNDFSPHLRVVSFTRVFSAILMTSENETSAVLCPRCTNRSAIAASMISALFGPWAARGPKCTIMAVQTALRGGERNPIKNARLLRDVGMGFLRHGYLDQARTAFEDSLSFERVPHVEGLLHAACFADSKLIPDTTKPHGRILAVVLFAIPVTVVGCILWLAIAYELGLKKKLAL